MQTYHVAMIGYRFMGKAHSFGIGNAPFFFDDDLMPVKKVICGRNEPLVSQAAAQLGWEEYETDWRKVVNRPDIDVVDIATPPVNHCEIALAAIAAGKHVFCEKPLAMNAAEARRMLEAAERAGIAHMLGHNYRRVPAIAYAHDLIGQGAIGDIRQFRAVYLQDWLMDPAHPMDWHLDAAIAGTGPHSDLHAHVVDLARWLVGEIAAVVGMQETFIGQRPVGLQDPLVKGRSASRGAQGNGKAKKQPDNLTGGTLPTGNPDSGEDLMDVTVEDASLFLARFANGAIGTFEATRMAGGHKNALRFEINGSRGTIAFDLERMNELQFWSMTEPQNLQGFRTILVTEKTHPYMDHWWPAGQMLGYENTFINEFADFFRCIRQKKPCSPNFHDGWRCSLVLDAVERSWDSGLWEKCE